MAARVIQSRGRTTQPADTARPEEAPPELRRQPQRGAPPPRATQASFSRPDAAAAAGAVRLSNDDHGEIMEQITRRDVLEHEEDCEEEESKGDESEGGESGQESEEGEEED
jgi:hypothetical protein